MLEFLLQSQRLCNDARGVPNLVDTTADVVTDEAIEPRLDALGAQGTAFRWIAATGGEILEQRARLTRYEGIAGEGGNPDVGVERPGTLRHAEAHAGQAEVPAIGTGEEHTPGGRRLAAVERGTVRDDAAAGDERTQREEFAADDRLERLHQIIGVDARIKAAQLPLLSEPLETPRLSPLVARKNERHVANLRISRPC